MGSIIFKRETLGPIPSLGQYITVLFCYELLQLCTATPSHLMNNIKIPVLLMCIVFRLSCFSFLFICNWERGTRVGGGGVSGEFLSSFCYVMFVIYIFFVHTKMLFVIIGNFYFLLIF